MSDRVTRHDAHALRLIDKALDDGRFTPELMAQICEALALAEREDAALSGSAQ